MTTGIYMKNTNHFLTGLLVVLFSTCVSAAELETDKEKLSYALGVYFSQGFTQQNIDVDNDAFLLAVKDTLNNSPLKMSQAEIQETLSQYQKKLAAERQSIAEQNKSAGEKFLEENAKKEGVVTLDNGLQYKVIKEGSGEKPTVDSNVKVHYHGTHLDGEVFDSSVERGEPISLSLNRCRAHDEGGFQMENLCAFRNGLRGKRCWRLH